MWGQIIRFGSIFAATAFLSCGALAEDGQVLNIYNWSDYIAPDTIPNFEKATGIKVNYDTYDSNETLEAKLAAGNSGYDIVVPSLTPFLARQIKAGFYAELNKQALTNYGHLDRHLLTIMAKYDAGNAHAIPWMTGTTGIGYNVDAIRKIMPDAPVDSLKLLFDPEIAQKFKDCGISVLDLPTEIYPAVLNYLGLPPDSQAPSDFQKATALLQKIRPFIRKFDSSEYINDLANGDLCLVWGYSSDVNLAKRRAAEAKKGVRIAYSIPQEGTQRYIDTMGISKDAPHQDAALKFLNYIMQPEVIAETSNKFFIQSGNEDALKFVRPEISGDAGIFAPSTVEATLFSVSPSTPEIDRLRTRLWARVKSGY